MTDPVFLTSTLTLHAAGNSLPQLFENIARELLKVFIDTETVGEVLREKIVVEAADSALLLQGWVNALLGLSSTQHLLFKAYRFQQFEAERQGAGHLRAEITGELVDPHRHTFLKDPALWHCAQVALINTSKCIEAEVILTAKP